MSMILEISLGVLVVFLFLSLVVSAVGEAISTWLSLRYKQLRGGIASLLQGDASQLNGFLQHPLIKALGRGGNAKPSYLRGETFAQVLLDQLRANALRSQVTEMIEAAADGLVDEAAKKRLQGLAAAAAGDIGAVIDQINDLPDGDMKSTLKPLTAGWMEQVRAWATAAGTNGGSLIHQIGSLPESDLKSVLQTLIADGKHSTAEMQMKLVGYYDATMERVSGWYKRRMQVMLFAVGFVLCAMLNVDIFVLVPLLHHDAHLRQQLAGVAAQVGSQPGAPTLAEIDARFEEISLPFGWEGEAASPQAVRGGPSATPARENLRGGPRAELLWWLKKVLGVSLCALAVSFGAPFWFDLLSKVVSIRSAVRVPAGRKSDDTLAPSTASPPK